MKKLLTLLALAGLSTAVACGDDSGDDGDKGNDAGLRDSSAGPISRGKQIDNLAASCKTTGDCTGSGGVECLTEFFMQELPGGYCTAQCELDDECGPKGACPVAGLSKNALFQQLISTVGDLIPKQCVEKCTASDASPRGDCTNPAHNCTTLIPANAPATITGLIGGLPELKQTYCFPPIMINLDGGIPDAGAIADFLGGLDAGL